MGNSSFGILYPDLTFPTDAILGSIFPAGTSCLSLNLLGGTLADSLTNFVDPAAPLTAVGSPTINTNDVTTSATNLFDTGKQIATDFTIAVVAKLSATAPAHFAGNINSGATNGDALTYIPASNIVRGYFGYAATVSPSTVGLSTSRHRLIIMRLGGTAAKVDVYDDSATPVPVSATGVCSTRNGSTRTFRVGAAQEAAGGTFGAAGSTPTLAFHGLWNTYLSDSQILNELRPFLADALPSALGAAV